MKTHCWLFAILALLANISFAQDKSAKSIDLEGEWNIKVSMPEGEDAVTWIIVKEDGKLTGKGIDHEDDEEFTFDRITVDGNKATVEVDVDQDGNTIVIRAEVEQLTRDTLKGEISATAENDAVLMEAKLKGTRAIQYAGEWNTVSTMRNGNELESVLNLKGKNNALTGVLQRKAGDIDLDKVSIKDGQVRIEFELDMNGNSIECVVEAKPKGANQLVGKWNVERPNGNVMTGDWKATRKAPTLAGTWDVVAVVPDSPEYNGTLVLELNDGKYSGTNEGQNGDVKELTMVKVGVAEIEIAFPFESGGNEGSIGVEAKLQKDGSLKGEWFLTDDSGQEWVRDEWKATRKEN